MGIVEEFFKYPTGNIADALWALGYLSAIHHEIRPLFTPIKLAGRALTIKVERSKRAGDKSEVATTAKENSKPGDIIILACGGYRHEDAVIWGENSMTSCLVRGAKGAVIDGGCRDTAALREIRAPIFTRAISPGGRKNTMSVVDYNIPVMCGGIRVRPGDIIIGDDDGVCVIPKEIETDALKAVKIYGERDGAVAPALRQGKTVAEAYSLKKGWEKEAGINK